MLSLSLLGPFQAALDQRPLTNFNTVKAQALLIYLAVEPHVHQREALMALLWPDLPLQSAQQSLRQTLYRLRQVIEPDDFEEPLILAERFTLAWNPDASFQLDTAEFETLSGLARTPADWRQAAGLYRGEFLADFYVTDSEAYEEWAAGRRAAYHRIAQELFQRLAAHYLAQGQFGEAETAVRRNLDLDYFQETAHRQLMTVLAANHRRQEALLHYDDFHRRLRDELAIEPEEETAELVNAIRAGKMELAELPQPDQPAVRQLETAPRREAEAPLAAVENNLPTPPTPFIGRQAELAALDSLMSQDDGRLVTIVGPGGMGKTRLALAWAANQLHHRNGHVMLPYQHGIKFLNLAPLPTADLLIATLANVLDFPLQKSSDRESRSPRQQLLDYLCQKRMLLLFDNFEHLLDGADLIVDILDAAANVKILVTSRERLNLRQEQIYPIQGLEFPDWETPEDALQYTAVQLFLLSAQRNLPDFTLAGGDDLTYLARICRLVAGMPLAIELAAAWVEMLPLETIAAEIQQGLDILETEMRDVPPRQRSVRATLDYSWQKLTAPEQEIFARLSVFRGGFSREAAEVVAGANLRQLSRLQNKSLLQVDREDGRFQLHELPRQYAAQKLARDPETAETINGRHAHYFVEFLAAQEPHLYGPQEEHTLHLLDLDRDNIDAAWQWMVSHEVVEPLLEAVNALYMYYDIRVRVKDGVKRSHELINWCSSPESDHHKLLLARALNWYSQINLYYLFDDQQIKENLALAAGLLDDLVQSGFPMSLDDDLAHNHYLNGLYAQPGVTITETALSHFESALHFFHKAGNLRGIVITLEHLVSAQFFSFESNKGGYKSALELGDQALKIARTIKSARLMTDLVAEVGTISLQGGDFALMETLMVEVEKALVRLKETGTRFEPEGLLERYAWMLSLTGRHEEALETQLEYQLLRRELGLPLHPVTEFQYGHMLAHVGRFTEARTFYERSIALGRQTQSIWVEGLNTIVLGMNLIAAGELETAEATLRYGLSLQAQIDNGLNRAGNLGNYGTALARLGRYDEAKKYLLEALELILSAHGYLPLMETLPGIALVLAHGSPPQPEKAAELYGLLMSKPYYANSRLFQEMSGRYLREFVESLPEEQAQTAVERGQGLEIWEYTAELRKRLREEWGDLVFGD